MNRNIAFFISTNKKDTNSYQKAHKHFVNTAQSHKYNVYTSALGSVNINIAFEGTVSIKNNPGHEEIFSIGNLNSNPINNDRFLELIINKDSVSIKNDYAGSIPVFFSLRNHCSFSNIEPCVVLDSNTTSQDTSFENLYGFMRYSHFIWDETLHNHIYTILPDSQYIFDTKNRLFKSTYLQTVKSSDENINLSDKEVAQKLNELNDYLVYRSLSSYEQIILPLSSGYDSRMILASISKNKELSSKTKCFTYGAIGSIEVEAARRLTKELNITWEFINLPLKFLSKKYLLDIHNIFGSSLHMHGMYQIEFFNEVKKHINTGEKDCLTSGFMTGVPAGQHNSLLSINDNTKKLTEHMNRFSQSKCWTDEELEKCELFTNKNYIEKAEERFKLAFNRFIGKTYQKSVMFDIWTRQRNFISYHPRTLEWYIPIVSPHMNKEYANFFMSLSKKHLDDRKAVELLFEHHYPNLSKVVSNSNGIRSVSGTFENIIFFFSKILSRFKINHLLPLKYANIGFEFDTKALQHSKTGSVYPLLDTERNINNLVNKICTKEKIKELYDKAYNGDTKSYLKLITLQSIGLTMLQIEK